MEDGATEAQASGVPPPPHHVWLLTARAQVLEMDRYRCYANTLNRGAREATHAIDV